MNPPILHDGADAEAMVELRARSLGYEALYQEAMAALFFIRDEARSEAGAVGRARELLESHGFGTGGE